MTCQHCKAPTPDPTPDNQPQIFCLSCFKALEPLNWIFRCKCGALGNSSVRCLVCGSVGVTAVSDVLPF